MKPFDVMCEERPNAQLVSRRQFLTCDRRSIPKMRKRRNRRSTVALPLLCLNRHLPGLFMNVILIAAKDPCCPR
jgi:hypothetical protein